MNKPKIVSLKTLQAMKYDEIELSPYYDNLLGRMESRTTLFVYGTSGSGKSVFILKLADEYTKKYGKCLYVSHEESLKKSLQDRTVNFKLTSQKLFFGAHVDFEHLIDKIKRNHYRLVIIDSLQYMQLTYEQVQELLAVFAKRKIIFCFVSFATGYKKPKCNTDIMHACDIKLYFDAGKLTVDSRYKDEIVQKVLFKPSLKKGDAQQGSLF